MIAKITSGHRPDDERIYHREIETLKSLNLPILYISRYPGEIDLSDEFIHHIHFQDISLSRFREQVIRLLQDKKPSVVHFHEFQLLPVAKWVKRHLKAFTIYDVHEYLKPMWETYSSKPFPFKQMINAGLAWYEKQHLPDVDHILFANPMVAGNPYPSHEQKITVLENFPFLRHIAQRNSWPENPTLVYHGLLSPDRGIHTLLEAFSKVVMHFPESQLKLFGPASTPAFISELKEASLQLKVINNVDILPEIPHEDVWRELKSCTLGVIPFSSTPLSEHNTPTKLFEYMASGCAVVASDVKPIRSWSQNLFPLFQSGDSATLSQIIIDLLDHPEKLDEQRKNNQETIRTVAHWEKIQDRLLSLYQRAL